MVALLIGAAMAFGGSALFLSQFGTGGCSMDVQPEMVVHYTEVAQEVCDAELDYAEMQETNQIAWIQAIQCFANKNNSEGVVRVASKALQYFPKSETFYNVKGYHEIELKRYRSAVRTLSQGLRNVETPSSGTLENNLAWAGLWIEMDTNDMRRLYKRALAFDASDCEIIHTGLWVEYTVASDKAGHLRTEAINNYRSLRRSYDGCENRVSPSDNFGYEVVGAGVLDHAMATIIATSQLEQGHIDVRAFSRSGLQTVRVGLDHLGNERASTDLICEESVPVTRLRSKCRMLVRARN